MVTFSLAGNMHAGIKAIVLLSLLLSSAKPKALFQLKNTTHGQFNKHRELCTPAPCTHKTSSIMATAKYLVLPGSEQELFTFTTKKENDLICKINASHQRNADEGRGVIKRLIRGADVVKDSTP